MTVILHLKTVLKRKCRLVLMIIGLTVAAMTFSGTTRRILEGVNVHQYPAEQYRIRKTILSNQLHPTTTLYTEIKLSSPRSSGFFDRLYPARYPFNTSKAYNLTMRTRLTKMTDPCTGPRYNSIIIVRNGRWFVTSDNHPETNLSYTPEISVFGAYADDRDPSILRVRILGVSNTDLVKPVHCQLWYTGIDAAVVSLAVAEDTGRGYSIMNRQHQERLYTCSVPTAEFPHSVSLSFNRCYREAPLLPVHVPAESTNSLEGTTNKNYKLGVCVAVTYGSLDAYKLVEWFEMHMLLGVTEFNMYTSRVDSATMDVLRYYVQRGVLRLQEVGPPVDKWCRWCAKLSTISVLNDCMYRNMYRYDYVMVIDVDEFLIPRQHHTITQLIAHIENLTIAPSFLFTNVYFFLDHQSIPIGTAGIESKLHTMSSRRRIKPSTAGHAAKSIVNPRYCISIQNHYCMLKTKNTPAQWGLFVDNGLALLHHYKNCNTTSYNSTQCLQMKINQVDDNYALLYTHELIPRIMNAMTNFKISV